MAGSQSRSTLNSSTITSARKKYGTATPRNDTARATLSNSEFGRVPATSPSGTPTAMATSSAAAVSTSVLGARENSSCATEFCVR